MVSTSSLKYAINGVTTLVTLMFSISIITNINIALLATFMDSDIFLTILLIMLSEINIPSRNSIDLITCEITVPAIAIASDIEREMDLYMSLVMTTASVSTLTNALVDNSVDVITIASVRDLITILVLLKASDEIIDSLIVLVIARYNVLVIAIVSVKIFSMIDDSVVNPTVAPVVVPELLVANAATL